MRADMTALTKRGTLQTFAVVNNTVIRMCKYMYLLDLRGKIKTTRKVLNLFDKTNTNKEVMVVKQILNVQAELPALLGLGPSWQFREKQ
jgi:hypothetical protein